MAGVTFSPDGETLFVNIFGRARFDEDPLEGMTCAITGPWADGPL
jgi:secreted PhoX family phosphatase